MKTMLLKRSLLLVMAAAIVEAGVTPGARAAEPRAAQAEQLRNERGEHVMVGTISKIDHATGELSLESDGMQLDLHFPPSAIEGFTAGERVAVEMAISKTLPSEHGESRK